MFNVIYRPPEQHIDTDRIDFFKHAIVAKLVYWVTNLPVPRCGNLKNSHTVRDLYVNLLKRYSYQIVKRSTQIGSTLDLIFFDDRRST